MDSRQHCRHAAYTRFAERVGALSEEPEALVDLAIAISMHERHDVIPDAVRLEIDALADRVLERAEEATPKGRLAHLHEVLFEEEGFAGDEDTYDDPRNSYLPTVLRRRRGLPITLTLLYREVATQVGLDVIGINAPGHFLAEVRLPNEAPMLVDPFHGGRVLGREEAFAQIDELAGARLPRTADWLDPATDRDWITRILRNLVNVFAARGRQSDLAAMLELISLVSPIPR